MTPHCFWCLKPTLIISFHNCFHQDHRLCRNNERTNLQKKINSKNCIFLVQLKQNIACRGIRAIRKIISHKCLKGFAFNQQNFHVGIIRYKSYTEVSLAIISFFLISINCPIFSFMIISKLGDPNSATLKTQQQNCYVLRILKRNRFSSCKTYFPALIDEYLVPCTILAKTFLLKINNLHKY